MYETTQIFFTLAPACLANLVVALQIPLGSIVPSVGLYRVPKIQKSTKISKEHTKNSIYTKSITKLFVWKIPYQADGNKYISNNSNSFSFGRSVVETVQVNTDHLVYNASVRDGGRHPVHCAGSVSAGAGISHHLSCDLLNVFDELVWYPRLCVTPRDDRQW